MGCGSSKSGTPQVADHPLPASKYRQTTQTSGAGEISRSEAPHPLPASEAMLKLRADMGSSDAALRCPFLSAEFTKGRPPMQLRNHVTGKKVTTVGPCPARDGHGDDGELHDCRQHMCTSSVMSYDPQQMFQKQQDAQLARKMEKEPAASPTSSRNGLGGVGGVSTRPPLSRKEQMLLEARDFIDLFHNELNLSAVDKEKRWQQITTEIEQTGTYVQTPEEL